jgi:rubrerythrin
MAAEFASEEAEHVAELEKWIDRVAADSTPASPR